MNRKEETKYLGGKRVRLRTTLHCDIGSNPLEVTLVARLESGRPIKDGFERLGMDQAIRIYLIDLIRSYSSDYSEGENRTATLRSDEYELKATFLLTDSADCD